MHVVSKILFFTAIGILVMGMQGCAKHTKVKKKKNFEESKYCSIAKTEMIG